jgi:hypothetical protein
MYLGVIEVKPLTNFKLELIFENNEIRIFDMNPYLDNGIFLELKNEILFNSVKINFDTIEWANGADLDPETLYHESIPISKNKSSA